MDSSEQQHASEDPASRSGSQQRLALIEVEGRDGRPQRLVGVHAWPVTLGRGIDNDIVLDDPHVAARHARLVADEAGGITLEVLDTTNGVQCGRPRLPRHARQALPAAGATLQIGATQLRVRLRGEVLAPERPLPDVKHNTTARALLAGAVMLALEFGGHWISLDPGADYSAWISNVVGLPVAIATWCAAWALLTKLFRHRFDFMGHLRIALPWLLLLSVVNSAWPLLFSSLNLPSLWQWSGAAQAVVLAFMVRAHLGHALPAHPRVVSAAVAAATLAWGGISMAGTYRAANSLHGTPYMSTLPLPALRWAGTAPSSTLVQDMAPLADSLAQRAKKAREEDRDDGAGSED